MRRTFALMLALVSLPAFAAEDRLIDFTTVIKNQDGVALVECADLTDRECKQTRVVTLGSVAFSALTNVVRDPAGRPETIPAEESVKRGQLGFRIYKSADAKLTAEDIALIKQQIGKMFNPMIVVRAFEVLDPNSK